MKYVVLIIFMILNSIYLFGQETKVKVARATIIEGDTVPLFALPTLFIYEEQTFTSKKEAKRYNRLKRDVMIVYPYAKLAGQKLREYESRIDSLKNDRERNKFLKQLEKDLEAEFGNELRDLTIRQGTILISLIDRETGDTSYALVRELRGAFSAFFWQSLARLFGHNLKENYNPEGNQQAIEQIVMLIEKGVYTYE